MAVATVASHAQQTGVVASLASARSELHQEQDRLSAARNQLGSTSGQADTVERALASDTALLTRDRAQLAGIEARTDGQGADLAELHLCLAGVERALNQFALGDRSGAMATLGTTTASCRDAQPAGA